MVKTVPWTVSNQGEIWLFGYLKIVIVNVMVVMDLYLFVKLCTMYMPQRGFAFAGVKLFVCS